MKNMKLKTAVIATTLTVVPVAMNQGNARAGTLSATGQQTEIRAKDSFFGGQMQVYKLADFTMKENGASGNDGGKKKKKGKTTGGNVENEGAGIGTPYVGFTTPGMEFLSVTIPSDMLAKIGVKDNAFNGTWTCDKKEISINTDGIKGAEFATGTYQVTIVQGEKGALLVVVDKSDLDAKKGVLIAIDGEFYKDKKGKVSLEVTDNGIAYATVQGVLYTYKFAPQILDNTTFASQINDMPTKAPLAINVSKDETTATVDKDVNASQKFETDKIDSVKVEIKNKNAIIYAKESKSGVIKGTNNLLVGHAHFEVPGKLMSILGCLDGKYTGGEFTKNLLKLNVPNRDKSQIANEEIIVVVQIGVDGKGLVPYAVNATTKACTGYAFTDLNIVSKMDANPKAEDGGYAFGASGNNIIWALAYDKNNKAFGIVVELDTYGQPKRSYKASANVDPHKVKNVKFEKGTMTVDMTDGSTVVLTMDNSTRPVPLGKADSELFQK